MGSSTANDNAGQVIQKESGLYAEAWVEQVSGLLSKILSDAAYKTLIGRLTEEDVIKTFNGASKLFVNNKVSRDLGRVAYVSPDVYSSIVDSKLSTTAKGAAVSIDGNEHYKSKSFILDRLAEEYSQKGENIILAADNAGAAGVGTKVYRTLDSEDFTGAAVQAAAKYGKHISEENKKATVKTKLATTTA